MATLISARGLSKTFTAHTLFRGVSLQISEGERMGIIGPNGAGKSTLLKILAGLETPDDGEITRRRGLRQVYVAQQDEFEPDMSVMSVVEGADETLDRHDAETRAAIILTRLGFSDFDQSAATLSGGWRKRLAMARALMREPEVLLLDEPTNHLDLEGIEWLEGFVRQSELALVFITHDRRFLENAATRIVELSAAYPDGTLEVKGNYTEFVRRRDEFLDGQAAAEATLANMVRRDTAWLQQGIQARRTRIKTHIEDAADRREELKSIRERNDAPTRTTTIDFQGTERKTRKLIELKDVAKSLGGRCLFAGIDLLLSPGRRVGLVGVNGSGKSTLLKVVGGELAPDQGHVSRVDNLRVVTFTQHRSALNPEHTLHEALCPHGDFVEFAGKAIHVSGWARRFLFATTQLRTFVRHLSGGEQARVMIARLMLEPADVLLLDEPTNDLDIPSLEVLEQSLLEFPGAIVLITHDRFMMERVATEFLALDGAGGARGVASYEQVMAGVGRREPEAPTPRAPAPVPDSDRAKPSGTGRKLSYKEQRELDGMESAISAAEASVESLRAKTMDPGVLADHQKAAAAFQRLAEAEQLVAGLYSRWAELESAQR